MSKSFDTVEELLGDRQAKKAISSIFASMIKAVHANPALPYSAADIGEIDRQGDFLKEFAAFVMDLFSGDSSDIEQDDGVIDSAEDYEPDEEEEYEYDEYEEEEEEEQDDSYDE